jgi:tRNA G18 (ribose-2'-O)-methylase SpoU
MKLSNKKRQELVIKKFEKEKRLNQLAIAGEGELIIVLESLRPDFNIGKIFRTAFALGVNSIYLIGIDQFDPYPAKGCFRKVPAFFFTTIDECYSELKSKGYQIVLFDTHSEQKLRDFHYNKKVAFVFGHEEFGPSSVAKETSEHTVALKQYGNVESLNVSVACSLAIYHYSMTYL